MYNLLMSGNPDYWNGDPVLLNADRCVCVREYTDKTIADKYGDFTEAQKESIKQFPCIFAYEANHEKDPKFGRIHKITKRKGKVKIEYELFELDKFITHEEISDMSFDLDITDWELKRSHWAIKDIDLRDELSKKDIELPRWSESIDVATHQFDVALSFPGEIRDDVRSVAHEVKKIRGPHACFYDEDYQAQLARPSLDTLLQHIYRNQSKLVVVFLCEKYQEKEWCSIEFRAIREIIFERDHKKVMFIKIDDGNVEGVFKTDGYIDARKHTPKEIADFINDRLCSHEY